MFANRRKSTGPDLHESTQPQSSNRDSLLLSVPPQIPAQNLQYSPIDTDEWALPSEHEEEHATVARQPVAEQTNSLLIAKDVLAPSTDSSSRERARDFGQEDELQSRSETSQLPTAPHVSVIQPDEVVDTEDRTAEAAVLEAQHSPQVRALAEEREEDHAAKTASLEERQPSQADALAREANEDFIEETASQQEERALLMEAVAEGNATKVGAPTGPEHSETVPTTQIPASDEAGLVVPTNRQPSVISTVSSASPSPAASQEAETNARRSVSPDEHNRALAEEAPSYAPLPTKEEEALKDSTAAVEEDDPVPSYHKDPSKRQSRVPRIEPDAQIVHVADLSQQKRQDVSRQSRPFSFEGSETIKRALQQQISAPDNNDSAQPFSPVSQALSKEMSVVSTEEVDDGQNEINKRNSRSYSRPFGTDPIRDHPALRQPESAIDRSQMYSSESPLPSARRSQQELERLRTNSPPVQQPIEEENYRIPGPYHMEYRSPRRSSPQAAFPPVQQLQSPLSQNPPGVTQAPNTYQRQPRSPDRQEPVPAPRPAPAPAERPGSSRSKQRSFVGIFRNRSQSRSRRGKKPENDASAFVRNDGRDDSMHSHQSESRDVVGQLPTPDKKQRRFSRDPGRSSTPTEGEPKDKKKRFSAMGNLFGRSSKSQKPASPQRASTLPLNATHPTRQPQQSYQEQEQVYSAALNRAYSGRVIQDFSGSPPPPGGYYAPAGQEGYFQDTSAGDSARYHRMSTHAPVYSQVSQQPDHATYQPPSQRPTNLYIDTSGNQPRNNSVPATAPPHTYAPRDISYQSRAYNPVSTRGAESAITPNQPNSHVVNLHKRSRSPKLGRYSPEDDQAARAQNPQNEKLGLGTFSNKKLSPVGGIPRPSEDQEAPYRITLPGDSEEQKRRTRQLMIEQGQVKDVSSVASTTGSSGPTKTVAERMAGPQVPGSDTPSGAVAVRAPLHERPNGSVNQKGYVAELPGSKANGYESEEEIPMSATAGPGQWSDPLFMGEWRDD